MVKNNLREDTTEQHKTSQPRGGFGARNGGTRGWVEAARFESMGRCTAGKLQRILADTRFSQHAKWNMAGFVLYLHIDLSEDENSRSSLRSSANSISYVGTFRPRPGAAVVHKFAGCAQARPDPSQNRAWVGAPGLHPTQAKTGLGWGPPASTPPKPKPGLGGGPGLCHRSSETHAKMG